MFRLSGFYLSKGHLDPHPVIQNVALGSLGVYSGLNKMCLNPLSQPLSRVCQLSLAHRLSEVLAPGLAERRLFFWVFLFSSLSPGFPGVAFSLRVMTQPHISDVTSPA